MVARCQKVEALPKALVGTGGEDTVDVVACQCHLAGSLIVVLLKTCLFCAPCAVVALISVGLSEMDKSDSAGGGRKKKKKKRRAKNNARSVEEGKKERIEAIRSSGTD